MSVLGPLVVAGSLLAACGGSPLLEIAQADLDAHRTLWAQRPTHDYVFVYDSRCQVCTRETVEITVVDGAIESVVGLDSDESPEGYTRFYTIDGLFDRIQDAIDRDADWLRSDYDRDLGYPAHVAIDYESNAIDEEWGFTIRSYGHIVC